MTLSNMPRRRSFSATATALSRTQGPPGDPRELRGVLALGDGRGLEFRARPPPGWKQRNADRRGAVERRAARGSARRVPRRDPAQPHAVRVPDPGDQGAPPRPRRRRRASGAARRFGLCRRSDCRDREPRRGAPAASRRWQRRRLGVPAAGPANNPAADDARGGDHAQLLRMFELPVLPAKKCLPGASGPARSPPSLRRRVRDRSWARRWARHCCSRWRGR